jgi:hypothetical protein
MSLRSVITWLENGCDPKEAVKELEYHEKNMTALKEQLATVTKELALSDSMYKLVLLERNAAEAELNKLRSSEPVIGDYIYCPDYDDTTGSMIDTGGAYIPANKLEVEQGLSCKLYAHPQVPEGKVLVPIEPTWDMTRCGLFSVNVKCDCGAEHSTSLSHNKMTELYKAMITASKER